MNRLLLIIMYLYEAKHCAPLHEGPWPLYKLQPQSVDGMDQLGMCKAASALTHGNDRRKTGQGTGGLALPVRGQPTRRHVCGWQ